MYLVFGLRPSPPLPKLPRSRQVPLDRPGHCSKRESGRLREGYRRQAAWEDWDE